MDLNKFLKKIDVIDMSLIKFSVLFFTLWIVSLFPDFGEWIISIDHWYFLIVFLVISIRPIYRVYLKK